MDSLPSPAVADVKHELQRLRQGQGLARPGVVLQLSARLRARLGGGRDDSAGSAEEIARLGDAVRRAIKSLNRHQRLYAEVDFNLSEEHSYPTLTERQESLARVLGCAAKTVRRRADDALETVAFLLTDPNAATQPVPSTPDQLSPSTPPMPVDGSWRISLRRFWRLSPHTQVDIVCSEIPEEERPEFALPRDRNYLRYAKFADLDTLIYVRGQLTATQPDTRVRDFAPSEYHRSDATTLIVIGGPPWNAKYREFMPQLPYHFHPNPLGEDDPLVVPQLNDLTIGPRWTDHGELLSDLAVFTRLTFAEDTTVFLLGGCLTLGVLGAGHLFLQGSRGAANINYITELVGDSDFVLVTETRRVGGITDVADLTTVPPLLLLARRHNAPFEVVADHTQART